MPRSIASRYGPGSPGTCPAARNAITASDVTDVAGPNPPDSQRRRARDDLRCSSARWIAALHRRGGRAFGVVPAGPRRGPRRPTQPTGMRDRVRTNNPAGMPTSAWAWIAAAMAACPRGRGHATRGHSSPSWTRWIHELSAHLKIRYFAGFSAAPAAISRK